MYQKSAVQFERLFSSSGYIVNKKRSSLDANTINMLVCLLIQLNIPRHLSEKTFVIFTVFN